MQRRRDLSAVTVTCLSKLQRWWEGVPTGPSEKTWQEDLVELDAGLVLVA